MASLESIASALASTAAGSTAATSTARTYRATVNGDGTVTVDGSTTTTPATYTVSAGAGDRVTVTIEGHVATVTGNITDPSASSASVDSVETYVKENYYTKTETDAAISTELGSALYDSDGNAVYAATSTVTQTAEELTAVFTSSVGANLLTDPGFESTAYGGDLPSGFAYSTGDPHSGTYCMACTGSGTRYHFNHAYGDATDPVAITVEPDETYVYSMWYKAGDSSAAWAGDNMGLRVATADGDDTLLCSHSTGSIGTDWTQITGTWTNSEGHTEVHVMVTTSVTSGTVYVDDAYFGPSVASGTLIRESGDGVEVAKYSGDSYSTTRTLMAADGFHVQDSDGADLTVVDSDGMTVYGADRMLAGFTSTGFVLHPDPVHEGGTSTVSIDNSGIIIEESSESAAYIRYDVSDSVSELSFEADYVSVTSNVKDMYIDSDIVGFSGMVSAPIGYFDETYMTYSSGDSVDLTGIICHGYSTASTTVRFMVPLSKPMTATSASATIVATVREGGSVVTGSSSAGTSLTVSSATILENGVRIYCTGSGFTADEPAALYLWSGSEIVFS